LPAADGEAGNVAVEALHLARDEDGISLFVKADDDHHAS